MAKNGNNLYLALLLSSVLFLGSLINTCFALPIYCKIRFDKLSVYLFSSLTETPLQEGNFTLERWVENVTVALITGAATIIGTLVGYVLTLRAAKRSEKMKFARAVLKGLRGLISEIDENERLIQIGKEVNNNVWNAIRYQYWFIPPVIEKKIEDNLRQLYSLLEDYNRELSAIKISNPAILKELIQEYARRNNIQIMIQTVRADLEKIAVRIVKKALF